MKKIPFAVVKMVNIVLLMIPVRNMLDIILRTENHNSRIKAG